MRVTVAYALPEQQWWLEVDVPDDATVIHSIYASGILDAAPGISLESQRVGIFGRFTQLEAKVVEGDRVEIYRPITFKPDEEDEDD